MATPTVRPILNKRIEGQDAAKARAFAWDCFLTFFGDGKDISSKETVAAIGESVQISRFAVFALGEDEEEETGEEE